MATFNLPQAQIQDSTAEEQAQLSPAASKAVEIARRLLEARFGTLDGETDVDIGSVDIDAVLAPGGVGKPEEWGRAIANAVAEAIPHTAAARLLSSDARTFLGPLVPAGTGAVPTTEAWTMVGWELGNAAPGQELLTYLQQTGNTTAYQQVGAGVRARLQDVPALQTHMGSGAESFAGNLLTFYQGAIREGYSTSTDMDHTGRHFFANFYFGARSEYCRARLGLNEDLKRWCRDMWADKGAELHRRLFLDVTRFPFDRLGNLPRTQLPQLQWPAVSATTLIDQAALRCVQLESRGDPAGAVRQANAFSGLDRYRVILRWRALQSGDGWTSWEIHTNPLRPEPLIHNGVTTRGIAPSVAPDASAAAASGALYKGKAVFVTAQAANGWWQIDLGDKQAYLPQDAVVGVTMTAVPGPITSRQRTDLEVDPDDVIQGQIGDCYFLAALIAVATSQPAAISDMIHDHGDGQVSVRFFRNGAKEEWVRISTTLPVGGGRTIYAAPPAAEEGSFKIWPAVLEKAYAAWKGAPDAKSAGQYAKINGGHVNEALNEILGSGRGKYRSIDPKYQLHPLTTADAHLSQLPGVPPDDLTQLIAYRQTQEWIDERAQVDTMRPWALAEKEYVVGCCRAAGMSKAGLAAIAAWADDALEGSLGSKQYSRNAVQLFDEVVNGLAGGKSMGLSTKKWGSDTSGLNGEDGVTVDGLYGTHAYAVVNAELDKDGSRWIVLRNPHGRTGRDYRKPSFLKRLFGSSTIKVEATTSGTFRVELSDVIRYFHGLAYSEITA